MPRSKGTQLDRQGVAERCGFTGPHIIDTYRQRQVFPEPDGHLGRSPWWYSSTIDKWQRTRRRRGTGKDTDATT